MCTRYLSSEIEEFCSDVDGRERNRCRGVRDQTGLDRVKRILNVLDILQVIYIKIIPNKKDNNSNNI